MTLTRLLKISSRYTLKNFNANSVIILGIVFCKSADNLEINYTNESLDVESSTDRYSFFFK